MASTSTLERRQRKRDELTRLRAAARMGGTLAKRASDQIGPNARQSTWQRGCKRRSSELGAPVSRQVREQAEYLGRSVNRGLKVIESLQRAIDTLVHQGATWGVPWDAWMEAPPGLGVDTGAADELLEALRRRDSLDARQEKWVPGDHSAASTKAFEQGGSIAATGISDPDDPVHQALLERKLDTGDRERSDRLLAEAVRRGRPPEEDPDLSEAEDMLRAATTAPPFIGWAPEEIARQQRVLDRLAAKRLQWKPQGTPETALDRIGQQVIDNKLKTCTINAGNDACETLRKTGRWPATSSTVYFTSQVSDRHGSTVPDEDRDQAPRKVPKRETVTRKEIEREAAAERETAAREEAERVASCGCRNASNPFHVCLISCGCACNLRIRQEEWEANRTWLG